MAADVTDEELRLRRERRRQERLALNGGEFYVPEADPPYRYCAYCRRKREDREGHCNCG
jgi:hypothetical protein